MTDITPSPVTMLIFVFLCIFLQVRLSDGAADTITAAQSLTGDQTIVSAGGSFRLGFFKPGKLPNYYIGIWYNKVSTQTVVWVANRYKPIIDKYASELTVSKGNLVLLNESRIPIWSTNLGVHKDFDSLQAVLLDNGNLVVENVFGSNGPFLWESFNYPTDTWLPGSKFGINRITNTTQILESWKNMEDPSPGLFKLEPDAKVPSQYFLQWNDSVTYWSSGTWDGQSLSLIYEMRLNVVYNFSFVYNENESYFMYSLYKPSTISRHVMDSSGLVKQLTWLEPSKEWNMLTSQPSTQCQVYAPCGRFGLCNQDDSEFCSCIDGFEPKSPNEWRLKDYSSGCMRKASLKCRDERSDKDSEDEVSDKFIRGKNMKLPINLVAFDSARSEKECKAACLSNCSCTAYSYERNCSLWTDALLGLQLYSQYDPTGKTIYIKVASAAKEGFSVGLIVGSSVVLIIVVLVVLVILLKINTKGSTVKHELNEGSLVAFGYRELQNATKNFSDRLGGGGFGSVFRGTLMDSTTIAVKKLEGVSQGEKQFRAEVSTIGTVQHVNLVRLRGFCSEGFKKLLVYDYMPNGSLDAHLFNNKAIVLDWASRYNIALGTARGLSYLHEKCRDHIIHCDIKPENILLDSEFCAKVADFGLAKLMGREFSRVLTTIRGTRGYLAPEWISGMAITEKADVYSYGMVLFELISGRRNSEQHDLEKNDYFPILASMKIVNEEDDEEILGLLDSKLKRNADVNEVKRVMRVACWCIQDEEKDRPSMGQVVQMLEGLVVTNMPVVPRSLMLFTDNNDQVVFYTEASS